MFAEILAAGLTHIAREGKYYTREREVISRMKLSYAAARDMRTRGKSEEEIERFLENELKQVLYREFKPVCDESFKVEGE